jgi:hypothetical protein
MPTIPYKNREGKRVSGVTTIISGNLGWNKQPLMWWANQMGLDGKNHREEASKAADAGTIGHYLIDCDIKGIEPDMSQYKDTGLIEKGETCLINFLEWKKMVNLRTIATEVNLVSEKYQYGGTPDDIGIVIDKLAVVDWKTGNGVYPDMLIQLAAYKQLWEENNSDKPLEGGFHLLRIGKEDASFHHHHWQALPEAWEAFKHLLELHRIHKVLKKMS